MCVDNGCVDGRKVHGLDSGSSDNSDSDANRSVDQLMRTLRLTRLSVDAAPTGFLLAAVALDSGSIFVTFARNQLVFSRAGEELASLPFDEPPERVHAQWLGSRQMLSLAFGDDRLFALSLNDDGPPAISLVGQLESAITAACWSPDEEALALTTRALACTSLCVLLIIAQRPISSFSMPHTSLCASNRCGPESMDPVRPRSLALERSGSLDADAIVALGWGDVSTQFDGPGIKRQTRPTDDENEAIVLAAADDRDLISWRGDSEHFCVGTRDVDKLGVGKRMIRLYGRDGELKATNEPMTGLAATLAWQPSGSLIAAARQTLKDGSTANAVVLLERIGLQRSSFELEGCCGRIQAMAWDPTSTLLAVWLADTALSQESGVSPASPRSKPHAVLVRIYSRKNYHWCALPASAGRKPF